MTITTTFVTVLSRFKYLAEKVMYSNHYKPNSRSFITKGVPKDIKEIFLVIRNSSVCKVYGPVV
jgi:hypothetical protein